MFSGAYLFHFRSKTISMQSVMLMLAWQHPERAEVSAEGKKSSPRNIIIQWARVRLTARVKGCVLRLRSYLAIDDGNMRIGLLCGLGIVSLDMKARARLRTRWHDPVIQYLPGARVHPRAHACVSRSSPHAYSPFPPSLSPSPLVRLAGSSLFSYICTRTRLYKSSQVANETAKKRDRGRRE